MQMKTRVYVAGPISKGNLRRNIKQATDAGKELIKSGFAPMVPHLTCYFDGDEPDAHAGGFDLKTWYGVDFPWVATSHALLRLPGESTGADLEVAIAKAFGVPVFHSVNELIATLSPTFECVKK
jgi:hypothetical protein